MDGDGANSPFAAALVKHLAEPHVEIGKMFRLVTADVLVATAPNNSRSSWLARPGGLLFPAVKR